MQNAWYVLEGTAAERKTMQDFLEERGFELVEWEGHPALTDREEYKKALRMMLNHRVPGVGRQRKDILQHDVGTDTEMLLLMETDASREAQD